MANIKSAKKRIVTSAKRADRNKSIRSSVKTAVKKVYSAIEANDKEAAQTLLKEAISSLEKAGTKGVYHRCTVSRKVSRLTRAVNRMDKS